MMNSSRKAFLTIPDEDSRDIQMIQKAFVFGLSLCLQSLIASARMTQELLECMSHTTMKTTCEHQKSISRLHLSIDDFTLIPRSIV